MAKGNAGWAPAILILLGVVGLAGIADQTGATGARIIFVVVTCLAVAGVIYLVKSGYFRRIPSGVNYILAIEREHVRNSVHLVLDPTLTADEHLAVVDGFIPRLLAQGRPHAFHGPYRDRFVEINQLTGESQALLSRAERAAAVIGDSQVKRAGLLDAVANDVVLPQQIWEIARLLRMQSHLQYEQHRAREGVVTAELSAVLEPQQAALQRSVDSVTSRVEGLERYAYRVQEADAALRAREALRNNDKYLALLAHTDDTEGLAQLTSQADVLERTVASSIQEAVEAGQTLSL
ncbi:hypothetical protein Aple_056150 [Acrocarpospora pleiomorpha]|uniref:Uncharacterized protein n=1 Tax=Acrocarpospora pleiomorpha TaxID=90975 RepID=A0A5M3XPP7_9ACTN|nr:hypothetical protein Aple_056150 [Acrocarpospora pleiomorpha]